MSERFFSQHPLQTGPYTLDGEQAHHVANVMRKSVGDAITLFDGHGSEFLGQIRNVGKKQVEVEILEERAISREIRNELSLAVALPKGDRQKFLIEKLVEVGVSRLIPLQTRRSVAEAKPKVLERLEKQVVEASKQCGRNQLMEIQPAHSVTKLITEYSSTDCRFLADPYAEQRLQDVVDHEPAQHAIMAIGPEGGFTDEENSTLAEAGWTPVQFSSTILRVETAALVAATLLRQTN